MIEIVVFFIVLILVLNFLKLNNSIVKNIFNSMVKLEILKKNQIVNDLYNNLNLQNETDNLEKQFNASNNLSGNTNAKTPKLNSKTNTNFTYPKNEFLNVRTNNSTHFNRPGLPYGKVDYNFPPSNSGTYLAQLNARLSKYGTL